MESQQKPPTAVASAAPASRGETKASEGQQVDRTKTVPVEAAANPTLAAANAAAAAPATANTPNRLPGLDVSWRDGAPLLTDPETGFSFRPRGRITIDATHLGGSRFDDRNLSGTEARYLRLGAEGTIGRAFAYQLEGDFADNDLSVRSAFVSYVGQAGKDGFEISVGNRLSERGFDASTGSANTPLLERNLVAFGIRPQKGFFGLGLTGKYFGQNWHAAVQVDGDDINNPGDSNDTLTFLGRAHWNPVKSGPLTVHLGGWAWHENLPRSVTSITVTPYIGGHFADALQVSSGAYPQPGSSTAGGGELGLIGRHLYAYGEFGIRNLRSRLADRSPFNQTAWAITGGWVLTGEKPAYASRTGAWGRQQVLNPVGQGGSGAVEIVGRYEGIDFTDYVLGGDGWDATAGINWFINPELKFMANVIHWHTDNRTGDYQGSDDGNTISARMQLAF